MRTFPNAWVFPGGKIDPNENFITTLTREIYEETGIEINQNSQQEYTYQNFPVKIAPIMLYESVYCSGGLPSSHFLILYYGVKIGLPYEKITLNVQVNEVDAYCWIYADLLNKILNESHKCNFDGYVFTQELNIFSKINFCETNFVNGDNGEYVPYGHYLAFKSLRDSNIL